MNLDLVGRILIPWDIEVTYDDFGRIYHIYGKEYYSVTSALSVVSDHGFLSAWRSRTEDPDKVLRQAGKLGTDYHTLGENFLLNEPLPKVQWLAELFFKKTIPILEKNITSVKAVEYILYSELIKLAGRTDAVVMWNGELAVLDFKCIGNHNPAWLSGYWIQLSLYAHMFNFMYGMKPTKLVLICANKKNLQVKEFVATANDHAPAAVELVKQFHKKMGMV